MTSLPHIYLVEYTWTVGKRVRMERFHVAALSADNALDVAKEEIGSFYADKHPGGKWEVVPVRPFRVALV
jgi:hypothetical protein